jgi:PTS system cellobiose-specific IIB component
MNILLICGGGFSSSFLVQNMKKAALEKGLDVNIQAKAEGVLSGVVSNYDVVLVTPQLKYNEKRIGEICDQAGVPHIMIPSMAFGTMDGDAVMNLVLESLSQEGGES